jgi:hypothetical protein
VANISSVSAYMNSWDLRLTYKKYVEIFLLDIALPTTFCKLNIQKTVEINNFSDNLRGNF